MPLNQETNPKTIHEYIKKLIERLSQLTLNKGLYFQRKQIVILSSKNGKNRC